MTGRELAAAGLCVSIAVAIVAGCAPPRSHDADRAPPVSPALGSDPTSLPTASAPSAPLPARGGPTSVVSDGVVSGPAPEEPAPAPGVHIDPRADVHDFAILQEDLGPDFTIRQGISDPAVRPGTASAAGLPAGVDTALSMSAWYVYGGSPKATVCTPTGASSRDESCAARTLPGGRRYLVLRPSQVAETKSPSVTVYFIAPGNVVVQVNLTTRHLGGSGPTWTSATRRWTESMIVRLATAASDSRMEPWFYRYLGQDSRHLEPPAIPLRNEEHEKSPAPRNYLT